MKVSRLISSLRLARLKNIVNTGSDIQRAKKIDLLNKMSARANMSAKDQAAAQKIIDKIHSTTTTADEIRATAKALQEENARAEEARQAQAKASAIKAQEQARQSQAQAKQAEAQKYSDIRAKNQNLGVGRDAVELQCQPGTRDSGAYNKGTDGLTEAMILHEKPLLVEQVSGETKDDG